jgi:hypothetical protein
VIVAWLQFNFMLGGNEVTALGIYFPATFDHNFAMALPQVDQQAAM